MCSATKYADDRAVGQYVINLLLPNLVQQTLCLFHYLLCITINRQRLRMEPCMVPTMDHWVNKLR